MIDWLNDGWWGYEVWSKKNSKAQWVIDKEYMVTVYRYTDGQRIVYRGAGNTLEEAYKNKTNLAEQKHEIQIEYDTRRENREIKEKIDSILTVHKRTASVSKNLGDIFK